MIVPDDSGASHPPQAEVQLIVCDLGDTLVEEADPDWAAHVAGVLQLPDGEAIVGAAAALIGPLRDEADRAAPTQRPAGQIMNEFLRTDQSGLSLEVLLDGAWRLLGGDETAYLAPRPGAEELLETARARGVPVVALSNTALPAALVDRVLARHGLLQYLSATVYSSEVGWKKPAPRIFEIAQEAAGVAAGQCTVMIGNSWAADIEPALERKWRGVLVQSSGGEDVDGTQRRLQRVGDLYSAIDAIWGGAHA